MAQLASAETLNQIDPDRAKIEGEVQQEIAEWRRLLSDSVTGSVADGREFLRRVLAEPLKFTASGRTYKIRGRVRTGEGIAGAVVPPLVASPMPASWNQIMTWLQQIDRLRRAA
jgi:hypothetical protein